MSALESLIFLHNVTSYVGVSGLVGAMDVSSMLRSRIQNDTLDVLVHNLK